MAAVRHQVETTFINSWVEDGAYELVVNTAIAATMRRLEIDLVDVNHVLKTGEVFRSDMLESRGLWEVRGTTVNDVVLDIEIAVVSSECEVELLRIVKVKRSEA